MSPYEQLKHDKETQAYKLFMKIAKKVKNTEYGKWDIVPDSSDPLRKFILQYKSAWFTINVKLMMMQFTHRGNYTDSRYDYRPEIIIGGVCPINANDHIQRSYRKTYLRLQPRIAHIKLIEQM